MGADGKQAQHDLLCVNVLVSPFHLSCSCFLHRCSICERPISYAYSRKGSICMGVWKGSESTLSKEDAVLVAQRNPAGCGLVLQRIRLDQTPCCRMR